MKSGIYSIVNSVNGSAYIGSTTNFVQRRCDHFKLLRRGKHLARHLQAAFNKYGEAAFSFVVLLECASDQLLIEEQIAIDARIESSGRSSLYNACLKANRSEWSDESRQRLREKRIGSLNPFYGKKHSEEAGRSMSKSRKGRSTWNKGIKATAEHRAKIAASGVGRIQSVETRAKRSATMLRLKSEGKTFGPSHIENIVAAQRRRRSLEARTDL